jgi:hypothetical protein
VQRFQAEAQSLGVAEKAAMLNEIS